MINGSKNVVCARVDGANTTPLFLAAHFAKQNTKFGGGETYEGGFPAIVSKATFEKVQEVLKNRAKPRHSKKRHNFPFTGLLTCGECGAAITAQYAHGHGGTYKYYRCTKRLGSCSQSYLHEDLLTEQLKIEISKVALCEDWKEKMLAQVEVWEKENIQSSQSFAQNLDKEIKETESKLDRFLELRNGLLK